MKSEEKKTFIEWLKEIREKGTPVQQKKKFNVLLTFLELGLYRPLHRLK